VTAPAAIRHPTHLRLIAIGCLIVAASCLLGGAPSVQAATITASYEHGRDGVVINGYGTRAMGSFRLLDGDRTLLAWCVEADVPHVTQHGAYRSISPSVSSAELDALLWWLDREDSIDADTAVAAAALTWFYAGARRSIGPPVWSDGSRAFAPISPVSPELWDALPPFSLADPVGLIVPGTHLDAAERRVLELHRLAGQLAGPWELSIVTARDRASATVELRSPAGRLANQVIEVVVEVPGSAPLLRDATTADDGRAQIPLPDLPDGAVIRAAAASTSARAPTSIVDPAVSVTLPLTTHGSAAGPHRSSATVACAAAAGTRHASSKRIGRRRPRSASPGTRGVARTPKVSIALRYHTSAPHSDEKFPFPSTTFGPLLTT
jgi:hypothetical protein